MKKRYEKPETACMQIETISFVAASDVKTINVDTPTDQDTDIDKSHKSRTYNVWDEENDLDN